MGEETTREGLALAKTCPDILDFVDPQGEYQRLWDALSKIAIHGTGQSRYHAQQTLFDTEDEE